MRLTLLYTPGVRNSTQDQASQDEGRHRMLYALTSHAGDWRRGNVPWEAASLNQPLVAMQSSSHAGTLGRTFSLLKLNTDQVAIVAIKKAEDSDEIIVRLKELEGKQADQLQLLASVPILAAREVNGQEKEIGSAAIKNGAVRTDISSYSLRAFALKLGNPSMPAKVPESRPVDLQYDLDAFSTDKNYPDGDFDSAGHTFPAEQLPQHIINEGVDFLMGSTVDGQNNAVICRGQTISLPAGDHERLYLLAASVNGDTSGQFKIGDKRIGLSVQDWTGYIGQWDTRLWKGEVPELTYQWSNELDGLVPGFIKTAEVAWFCSHRHSSTTGNEYYQHTYLFKYGLDIPAGAHEVTLPDNPRIRIFAASAARLHLGWQ